MNENKPSFLTALQAIAKRAPSFIYDGGFYLTVEGREYTTEELKTDQGAVDRVQCAMQRFCATQDWAHGMKSLPARDHIEARVLVRPQTGPMIRYKCTGDSSAHALALALWDALLQHRPRTEVAQ